MKSALLFPEPQRQAAGSEGCRPGQRGIGAFRLHFKRSGQSNPQTCHRFPRSLQGTGGPLGTGDTLLLKRRSQDRSEKLELLINGSRESLRTPALRSGGPLLPQALPAEGSDSCTQGRGAPDYGKRQRAEHPAHPQGTGSIGQRPGGFPGL